MHKISVQAVPYTKSCEFESRYDIKFASDLRQVGGFLRVLR
jgi:hypothetical protein